MTVIDKDLHQAAQLSGAYAQHIGETKATVVAGLHAAAMESSDEIVPLAADACDFAQVDFAQTLAGAALAIDASTTLEYPRAASAVDTLPRHFSVFVTPNGNAAVLLAEDAKRMQRLRTLEAQYYRALIQQDWESPPRRPREHLLEQGELPRNISLVMPYSRILGQANTLTEQIQAAVAREDALIRIWQRDPARGGVEVHDVPAVPERRIALGEL